MNASQPPLVSFILPFRNEAHNINRCLDSVSKQDYPHDCIEILAADAASTDATCMLIEKWARDHDIAVQIINNPQIIAEFGKALAIKKANGTLICMLDADNEIVQSDWLTALVQSFSLFPSIFGFESHFLKIPGWSALNNYLTACLHIDDPLAWAIASRPREVERKVVDGKTYRRYDLPPGFPCGANGFVFRAEALETYEVRDTFEEGQFSLALELAGDAAICRVDGYGIYHYYCRNLRQFFNKKAKRAIKHVDRSRERTTWVDYTGNRIYLRAFLHLTLVAPLGYSLYQSIARREPLWLLHAPMAFFCTLTYGVNLIVNKLFHRKAW